MIFYNKQNDKTTDQVPLHKFITNTNPYVNVLQNYMYLANNSSV